MSKRENPKEKLEQLQIELNNLIALSEASSQTVELDQARMGRVTRGDALQQQAMASASLNRDKKRVLEVKKALVRIEEGYYGDCIECFEKISQARLNEYPELALCLECQSNAES